MSLQKCVIEFVPSLNNQDRESWRLLVRERIANIFLLCVFNLFFCSLQTSLLGIVVELAGCGSVADGISDRLKVTGNMQHVTNYFFTLIFFVSKLLSTHIKEFSVKKIPHTGDKASIDQCG